MPFVLLLAQLTFYRSGRSIKVFLAASSNAYRTVSRVKFQVLSMFWSDWGRWFKYQPLNRCRIYFGDTVAMYFAWLGESLSHALLFLTRYNSSRVITSHALSILTRYHFSRVITSHALSILSRYHFSCVITSHALLFLTRNYSSYALSLLTSLDVLSLLLSH